MKKVFLLTIALFLLATLSVADTVNIGQIWKKNKTASANQVQRVGFFYNVKQTILVLQIPNLRDFVLSGGSAAIYWNADNNKSTGRFADKGFDFQFNIHPKCKSYDLIYWDSNVRSDLVRNSSQGISINGDKLIIAIPSTLLNVCKIADNINFQIALFLNKRRVDGFSFNAKLPTKETPFFCTYTPVKTTSVIVKDSPAGNGISIPAYYTGNGTIRAVGVYRDVQKVIFAIVAPKIEKGDSLTIYWNSDGNRNTGRFAGRLGVDVQFIANLFEQNIKVFVYPPDQGNKHKKALTVYDDDFLIEAKNNVIFVAFKNETMEQVKLAQKNSMELVYMRGNQRERIPIELDLSNTSIGYIPEKLNFVRFGSLRQVRDKKALAIPLKNTPKGISIWDCQAERFEEKESTPKFAPAVDSFKIEAARNEMENLFFAIERKEPFSSLSLVPDKFIHTSGKILDKAAVSIKYADFVINDRNDKFTDVLLPKFPGRKVKRQFAVLSIKVPKNALSGIYNGSIAMTIDNKVVSNIPVKLEVFNFVLPEKSTFATAFAIKKSYISKKFRNRKVANNLFNALHKQAIKMRYGVRLLGADPKITLVDGKLNVDWSKYDKAKKDFNKYFNISQLTQLQLGSHDNFNRWNNLLKKKYKDTNDIEFKSVWEQFVINAIQHHREQKFIDNTLFIIWDEPYSRWNDIINAAKVIRKHGPEIPIGIFINKYKPELEEYIDVWLVSFGAIAQMRTNPKLAKKRVWLYNSGGVRDFRLPSSDLRGYYLLAWKYDIAGYLYSEINCIDQTGMKDGYFYNNYPTHTWMYVSNDGNMLYDSWRQLLVADGLDDYDYIKLYAEQLTKQGKKLPKWLKEKFPSFNKVNGSVEFSMDTITEWNVLRRRIARELESNL